MKNSTKQQAVMLFLAVSIVVAGSGITNLYGAPCAPSDRHSCYAEREHDVVVQEEDVQAFNADEVLPDIEPGTGEEVSLRKALFYDLIVPGGGHFYTGNTGLGVTFASLKVIGLWSLYYFYMDWKYRRSLYYAARDANRAIDPEHRLEFEDPDGGYKTVDEYEREYDRAAQRITFSILANVLIYSTSLVLTYCNVMRINENTVPTFEIQCSRATISGEGEVFLMTRYTYRY